MNNAILGYQPKNTVIHDMNALSKLIYFLLTTAALMLTYDVRLIILITCISLWCLHLSRVDWKSISFVVKMIIVFSLINLIAIYVLAPEFGPDLYGTRTELVHLGGRYSITSEQLFYEFNLLMKYFATVPLVLVFMLTMNPSEFASSFNRIGVPYKFAYAISLTLRYIPDIQHDYLNIRNAQAARGGQSDAYKTIMGKIRRTLKVVMPLIMTSFNRIDTISHAMMLRRFGQQKTRSWYVEKPLKSIDYWVIGLAVVWFLLFIALLIANGGRYYNPFL